VFTMLLQVLMMWAGPCLFAHQATVFAMSTDTNFSRGYALASRQVLIPTTDRQAHLQCTL